MKKTIIFLSGFLVPEFISKSPLCFDKSYWSEYETIFYKSKSPITDGTVSKELKNLTELVNSFHEPYVIGHSLGGWWAANLACSYQAKIKKTVLWTPLGMASAFPIFQISKQSEPFYKIPNETNVGPDKTLLVYANNDLIVPATAHALPFFDKFDSYQFELDGGHLFQNNHQETLYKMKKWLSY